MSNFTHSFAWMERLKLSNQQTLGTRDDLRCQHFEQGQFRNRLLPTVMVVMVMVLNGAGDAGDQAFSAAYHKLAAILHT